MSRLLRRWLEFRTLALPARTKLVAPKAQIWRDPQKVPGVQAPVQIDASGARPADGLSSLSVATWPSVGNRHGRLRANLVGHQQSSSFGIHPTPFEQRRPMTDAPVPRRYRSGCG